MCLKEGSNVTEKLELVKPSFASLFADSRKLDSVICLAKVPKVSTHIKIDAKDVEDVIKKWGYSELVACVVGGYPGTKPLMDMQFLEYFLSF